MYCKYCQSQIADDAKFCPNCGASQFEANQAGTNQNGSGQNGSNSYTSSDYGYSYDNANAGKVRNQQVVSEAIYKINTGYTLWLVFGIVQVVIGVLLLCVFYGAIPLGFGIWTLVQASSIKKNSMVFNEDPGLIYYYYEPRQTMLIVMLVINLILGNLSCCVPLIYDLVTRSYVISHFADLS